MVLRVFSTKKSGAAYVDVVKQGQTVLTRDLDIENGEAEVSLTATPELAGTVDLNAYLFGRDAQPIGDHRLIFVQPADELKIDAVADAPVYKPGGEARIRFRVTNSRGEGVSAALGLQVVDEAVFALAEKQPGFAKVFFYLEQEVMKPRYEIHSIGMPEVVEPVEDSKVEQQDRAARALFSATEMVNTNSFETEFGRTVPMTKYAEYAGRYQARFLVQVHDLAERLSRAYQRNSEKGDLTKVFARVASAGGPEHRVAWASLPNRGDGRQSRSNAAIGRCGRSRSGRTRGRDCRDDSAGNLDSWHDHGRCAQLRNGHFGRVRESAQTATVGRAAEIRVGLHDFWPRGGAACAGSDDRHDIPKSPERSRPVQ